MQNRVDQSVPLLRLVLTKSLRHEFQSSIPSLKNLLQMGWYGVLVRPFLLSSLDTSCMHLDIN